jgi:hypothetical protein
MVRSAQTVHLSCTDTNTVFKRTETRFHMTHVTLEYHQVRPKWFLSQWSVQCKPCTYLASRLPLSLNRPKWVSTWASSPSSSIGAFKTISKPMVLLAQPCTYLTLTQTLSPNGPKWAFTWASSPRSTIGFVQIDFWAYGTFSANRAPALHRH